MKLHVSIAVSAACLCSCMVPQLDVLPRFGTFDVDGDLGLSTTGVSAQNDIETMGLEKDDSVIGGRVDLKWGSPHLSVSTQSSTHDGDGTVETEISGDGFTFVAGTPIASELDLGIHSAVLTFDLIPTDVGELGLGLGVAAVDLDATFTSGLTGDTIDTDELVPLPLLAVRAGVELGDLEVSALLSGLSVKYDGDEATYLDLDAFGRYRLFGGSSRVRGSIVVGYRHVDVDVEYEEDGDEVDAEIQFGGPYFGVQFSL